ncbi:hypothetical protein ACJX0J_007239, partial [Zea mays]
VSLLHAVKLFDKLWLEVLDMIEKMAAQLKLKKTNWIHKWYIVIFLVYIYNFLYDIYTVNLCTVLLWKIAYSSSYFIYG